MVVRSPTPFGLGQNSCLRSRGSKLPRALPSHKPFFRSLNDRRRAACSLLEIGRLSSLFSCLSPARLRLLLMSGNVHSNPGPIFPCSVCAKSVTWRVRSVQCFTCSKWVHLKCLLLFFLDSELLAALTPGAVLSPFRYVPASFGDPTPTNTVTFFSDSSSMYTFTV